jgi:predicted ribosome quality control (RQC) complex YloA/Tae2 family protein
MIVDSGFRCHLTSFSRTTAATPSIFVSRLRKFLKTRRVTSVSQIGTDRIIEFQFSDGQYRMFLEFYAGGNIILTDKELNILTLLRIVAEGEGQEELRVGRKYSLENRQNYGGIPALTKERLKFALQKSVDKADGGAAGENKQRKKSGDTLRKALAVSLTEYPPLLVDHSLRIAGFDAGLRPTEVLGNEALIDGLMHALDEAKRVVTEITSSQVTKGYIIAKKDSGAISTKDSVTDIVKTARDNLKYGDFHPFKPRQFEEDPTCIFLEFDGFNKTVDEFFSSIEGQRLESRLQERQLAAKRKLEAAQQDQAKRLGGLVQVQELNERKAAAIEANIDRVQEAMDAVNSLIASGKDWVEIAKLIEFEQKRHNPVAVIIKLPLHLEHNTITLLLEEEEVEPEGEEEAYATDSDISDSEDEASKTQPAEQRLDSSLAIDINLGLSPWSNATEYHEQKRSAAVKEVKTAQALSKALKSQEQKIAQDLKKGPKQEKAVLRPVRQQMWFEKFIWFVSSDGYLVLGGRDSQQNEILYKRYLRKGDVGGSLSFTTSIN